MGLGSNAGAHFAFGQKTSRRYSFPPMSYGIMQIAVSVTSPRRAYYGLACDNTEHRAVYIHLA